MLAKRTAEPRDLFCHQSPASSLDDYYNFSLKVWRMRRLSPFGTEIDEGALHTVCRKKMMMIQPVTSIGLEETTVAGRKARTLWPLLVRARATRHAATGYCISTR